LYSSIKETVFGSKKVIEYRGKLNRDEETMYIWQRAANRDGSISYSINRDLPQIQFLHNSLDQPGQRVLGMLLQNIEQNFPASSVYLDVADGEMQAVVTDTSEIVDNLEVQLSFAEQLGLSRVELLSMLLKTEPYSKNEEVQKIFSEELNK
jgi:hypothetical protein